MYFTESAYLLHEGVAAKTVIEAVDTFLGDPNRTREDVLDASLVARHTDQDEDQVAAVLKGLAQRGALDQRDMARCPNHDCRTYTPASAVERARADGDEAPCDGPCGQNLAALNDIELVTTYTLVAQPV